MAVAAYIRVSSDKQDTERQEKAIKASGRKIDHWFRDAEGKNPRDLPHKRKEFQRLMKAVKAGLIDTIVVDRQDRFGAADAYQWGRFIDFLREHGTTLVDASGKVLSGDDDVSVLTGTIGAMTSAREQREKAHRNLGGKIPKAAQGEYQGGYTPYGCDVVCFGPDGQEKWRTVYVGHFKRWKVYPDGSRERFDGKDNTPAKDAHDTMRYRPSIETDRIKWAQKVFKWYADECISPGKIAQRLNDLDVDPVFGKYWNKVKVRTLLKNPVYIGLPTYNKRAGSRFIEYLNGQLREVPRTNGKARLGRWRDRSDFVQPAQQEFEPIVDLDTWNCVQRRLEESSDAANAVPKRAANTSELWLKPFLVCGHCGQPMRATRGGKNQAWPSYFCGSYGTYGRNNPYGCRCHRVQHGLLEQIVYDYLEQTAPATRELLDAIKVGNLDALAPMEGALVDLMQAYASLAVDMLHFLDDHATEEELRDLMGQQESIERAYQVVREKTIPKIEEAIKAKEAELDEMLTGFLGLSPKLQARANEKMEALQEEIDCLRGNVQDLLVPLSDLHEELAARRDAFDRALAEMQRDSGGRKKSAALSEAVEKIVLRFRHTEPKQRAKGKRKYNGKSYLDSVEIVPVSADQTIVTMEASPGPG